ncbi:C2H2 type zinc-finger-domain-containing protein [Suillus clintonianus]|uniref:C2H2 type zinc-finger-domain-containing protein n=1 Tax=Suillus clintonianus TaxID=1904413 RepID=UPI001B85FA44|nr:C2H2 type zinc-finger-domain-containing protein [Suillus clintonianus]KAG2150806.1 C2H2 type zinc-finger-domain-containing protein [Suillus clintonianus]
MDPTNEQPLFTCLSCSIAFLSAEEQRTHYRSDHHRYNMKRRVASLPPVSATVFNQKVLDRRQETAIMSSLKGSACEVCEKTYTTENAYRSHINSKKHKENELKTASQPNQPVHQQDEVPSAPVDPPPSSTLPVISETLLPKDTTLGVPATATEDEINESIDAKIAAARSRLSPTNCLFCTYTSSALSENLTHMSSAHSFFVPDAEYLVDLTGLITYLGEKIAVGNVCIYCNGKGRELRTLEAVRKHMLDKAHCKIAYDSEDDRLEVSDYYDFTTSYPAETRKKKSKQPRAEDEGWEDADDDSGDAEEVVDEDASEPPDSESDSDASIPDNQITYGDTEYELVLPSGARIGHRSMKRYYAQSLPMHIQRDEDPNSGIALVRRLLADKNSALVPRKGGFGAHGQGMEVVKARNRGEAREAGRHVREFRDQKRREDFKTRVGFIHNSQKHFRDPLLQ